MRSRARQASAAPPGVEAGMRTSKAVPIAGRDAFRSDPAGGAEGATAGAPPRVRRSQSRRLTAARGFTRRLGIDGIERKRASGEGSDGARGPRLAQSVTIATRLRRRKG